MFIKLNWSVMLCLALLLSTSVVNADQDGDIIHTEKLKVKDYTTGFDTCRHTFKNTSSCITYKCNAGGNPETGADGSLVGAAGFIPPKKTGHSVERCGASWVCTPEQVMGDSGRLVPRQKEGCKEDKKKKEKDVYYLYFSDLGYDRGVYNHNLYYLLFRTLEPCEREVSRSLKARCIPVTPETFPPELKTLPSGDIEQIGRMIEHLKQNPDIEVMNTSLPPS